MKRSFPLRRSALYLLLLCALALAACRKPPPQPAQSAPRIVSLAPAITETLFRIGASKQVIAVSDYCDSPPEVTKLPKAGTSITPNYEAIARLQPNLILGEDTGGARRRELEAVGKTRLLMWLSLGDVTRSVNELGAITGQTAQAKELAYSLEQRLGVQPDPNAPRVLLILGGDGSGANEELWFVRRNSLHGAALHGAGARNAIDEDIQGPPQLSQERLLALDPPFVVVLTQVKAGRTPPQGHGLERYSTLSAVQRGKVARLPSANAFSDGPSILKLVDELHSKLVQMGALP